MRIFVNRTEGGNQELRGDGMKVRREERRESLGIHGQGTARDGRVVAGREEVVIIGKK